ncbi:MAG: Calx-beta domain-containing protein [Isosphaeraceae bacterium]|nr:Calx-beta domain-containing protein [Isosphaeraceae bacterium]
MARTPRRPGSFVNQHRKTADIRSRIQLPHRPFLEVLEERVLLAAGVLGPSFGTGGLVDTNVANIKASYYNAKATAVLVEANGDIVAAGPFDDFAEFGAVRYLPNGTIDTSFGANGVAIASDGSTIEDVYAAALQPDGKIIVAGDSFISGHREFTLVRFNADGTLDTTFGNSGVVTTVVATGYDSTAYAVTVQPNGAILAVGYTEGLHGNTFALVLYNTDGTLDTAFGTGGIVQTHFATNSEDSAAAVALQQNDQIVVAGTTNNVIALARYNTNGTLDTTFGAGGLVTGPSGADSVTGVAIQPNGQVVVAGNALTGTQLFVSRFNANGTADTTFGTNGTTLTNGGATVANANGLALQPDGKILVTGGISFSSGYEFGTARFTSTGALDSIFGTGGFAVTSFAASFPLTGGIDQAYAIALQVDGGIVVAGYANGGNSIGIARYLNDLLAPNPLVVTNTNDSGIGSLRWAITNADGMTDTNTITFDIQGPAPYTISPLSALPAITNSTVIDGTSEPGYAGKPLIQLSGQNAGPGTDGLELLAGGSTVKGLAINGFTSSGISVDTNGGALIEGNFIGTDPTGTVALGNGGGGVFVIATAGPALAVTIGGTSAAARNVISGNSSSDGIDIVGASANGTLIEGNDIGTDLTGTVALPNGGGISVDNGAVNTTIGGTSAGAGNLISGNEDDGVSLSNQGGSPSGTLIEGNLIGTNIGGTLGLGNGTAGIEINGATNTTIGGIVAAARNVIAGNGTLNPGFDGVFVHGSGATGNLIEGNWIGLASSGIALSHEQINGIEINGVPNNTVGGTAAGAGNVISGNAQNGVLVSGAGASGNLIEGNYVGTDATGKVAVPNGVGLLVDSAASNTTIGGTAAGAGNLISGNTGDGIELSNTGGVPTGTLIQGNLIGIDTTGNTALPNLNGIELNGAAATTIGGTIAGARNIVSGNSVGNNGSFGIDVHGASAVGTLIEGNYIGTNSSGTVPVHNGTFGAEVTEPTGGIAVGGGAANTTIGGTATGAGNLISGNIGTDVCLPGVEGGTSTGTLIEGNRIGTDVTGTESFGGSTEDDVELQRATGVTIGGTAAGATNVIAGGGYAGISISSEFVSDVLVEGNFVGTNVSGRSALLGGDAIYVYLGSTGVTIGGTAAGAGNVIAGEGYGIEIEGGTGGNQDGTGAGALVQGNLIGTDITGTKSFGENTGIVISSPSGYAYARNTIGGTAAGAGNVIAFNSYDGIWASGMGTQHNLIQGNFIGTNAAGASLPNGGDGIELGSSDGNTIGATSAGAANIIAFNGGAGVKIDTASDGAGPYGVDNRVEGNSIFANGALGISLSPSGVTFNHVGGPVPGSNNLQNYPVLTAVSSSASSTTIQGTLSSEPNTTYHLEIFANATQDPSGYGQGQTYLGSWPVTTDSTGNVTFTATFPTALPLGYVISATATDPNGNTSEFSQDIAVPEADLAVGMTANPNPIAVGANATFVVTITNNGPNTASATALSDTLNGAFNVLSVTPSTGGTYTQSGNVITANFGSIASGAAATLTIVVSPTTTGSISDVASVSSAVNDPITSNNATSQTIVAESAGTLAFSAASDTASDDSGSATITVDRTGGDFGAVTVQYATSDGTAKAGTDYTATSGTLTFPDGVTSETFTVPILDDQTPDGTESLNLTLSSPTGGATLGTPSTAVLNLTDVPGAIQFSSPTYSVSESAGTATITVTRADGDGGAVSVHYATSDGTAGAGTDYTATSGTLNFPDGVDSETFTIPILDNPNPTGDLTVDLALSDATGGATLGSPTAAVLTIAQGAGSLQFSAPTYSIAENGGAVAITVTRTYGTAGAVSVQYATSDGSAKAGTDYTATTGTLNFPAGATSETIMVPVLDNPNPSGNVTVDLALTNPAGGAALGAPSTAVLTIDQGAGTFQFSALTYTVAENGGSATITVNRTHGTAGAVSVQYATSDGTAKAGTDYLTASGTLNFADGVGTETITVPILDNPDPSGNVNVNVLLSSPTGGATLGSPATAVLTINQGAGQFQFSAPSYSVMDNAASATITVTRTYGSAGAASVHYATTDGTARAGTDYTTAAGTLNFADGVSSQTFTVPIINDPNPDGTETLNLTLSDPTGAATLGNQATAVLNLTDVPGALQFSAASYNAAENSGTATITVTRTLGDGGPVSVHYATSDGTAKAGTDYTGTSGTLSFPDGVASESFPITLLDNPSPSGNVTVNLTLTSPAGGATFGTQSTAVLAIGQGAGTLQFSSPTYSVAENGGTATITVTRTFGTSGPVSVHYASSDGTATAGIDYTATSGTLNFPNGVNSETLTVPILDNPNPSGDVTVDLALSNATGGATVGAQSTTILTINQGAGTFAFSAPTYTVQDNGGSATITVDRTHGAAGAVSVQYATSDGTAKAGTAYSATAGTLDFPDGATSESFTVPILPGGIAAGSQTLNLSLSGVAGGATLGAQSTAVLDIATPPGTIAFSQATDNVNASNASIILTLTRSGGSGGVVSVQYATSDGTAKAGTDYTGTSGTLVFSDGFTSQTLTIPILNNPARAGNVAFTVTLSNPGGGASLGTQTSATVTIVDNAVPAPPGVPQLSAQSDTGASSSDGLTRDNGSTAAPLTFTVGNISPPNAFVQLYTVPPTGSPVPFGNPAQAVGGLATITVNDTPLADGTYQIAASASLSAGGTQSALSGTHSVTIQTSLRVTSISPGGNFYSSLPNEQVTVTFNHWLAGVTTDPSTGFASPPFAVMLVPAGPDGLATQQRTGVFWAGTSGYDTGDLPLPATLKYTQNADGTATITLTPHQPLSTDIYLITVNGLSDLAGNPVASANGAVGNVYSSFDYRPVNTSAPTITSVTAEHGMLVINNNSNIPLPDTIAIGFSRPMDTYTINTKTVQLLPQGSSTPVTAAVTYSPATMTAYLTPEAMLTPGTPYTINVTTAVTDDEGFPATGVPLAQGLSRTFTVTGAPPAGRSPLTVTATSPAAGTNWSQPLGYGTVTFSEALTLDASHVGRFSAMLVPHTGGVTTGGSGYADVPYDAKLAFNPNTNQLVLVFTGVADASSSGVLQVFALTGIHASNGDALQPDPGTSAPVYRNFEITSATASPAVMLANQSTAVVPVPSPGVAASSLVAKPREADGPSRPVRPSQALPVLDSLRRPGPERAALRVPAGPLGTRRRS